MGLTIRKLTFTCLLIAVAATFVQASRVKRIINGETSSLKKFPFMASLKKLEGGKLNHFCGGSIITERYILTAAHCVVDEKKLDEIKVVVGTVKLQSKEEAHAVQKIDIHKQYDKDNPSNLYDIAILTLSRDLTPPLKWQPIKLASKKYSEGAEVFTAGWGCTDPNNEKYSAILANYRSKLGSSSDCFKNSMNRFDKTHHLCTLEDGGKSICKGDSGGPLVANNEVIGITSFTNTKKLGKFPSIFANVRAYKDFIEKITGIKMEDTQQ